MQTFTFLTGRPTVFQATVGNLEDSSLHWESVPWATLQYTDSQLEAHQLFKKLSKELPYGPAIPLLDTKRIENRVKRPGVKQENKKVVITR